MQLKHSNVYVVSYERVSKKSRHKGGHSSITYETVVKIPITSGPRRSPASFGRFLVGSLAHIFLRYERITSLGALFQRWLFPRSLHLRIAYHVPSRWVNGSRRTHIIAGQIILFEILLAKQTCLSRGHDNKCLSLPIRSAGDKGRECVGPIYGP